MNPKIKNIIIFSAVGIALVLVYIFFIKKAPAENSLVSSSDTPGVSSESTSALSENKTEMGSEFLAIFLNIKNIKLNDSIFSEPAFSLLKDSSITLVPDGNEGRTNPFAPIGSESLSSQIPQVGIPNNKTSPTSTPKT